MINRKDNKNIDEITRRRNAIKEKRSKKKRNYLNKNTINTKKNRRTNDLFKLNKNIKKDKRNKRKVLNKKSFKGYYIVLGIAIIILLIAIFTGNKKDDVSKYFYLNNQKINTINPIKIKLAKNNTAKVAIFSFDDIQKLFDQNIRYNEDENEIITIGKTHVARLILNDYAINLNGTDSVINVSVFKEDGKIYIPLNDLSSVYGIEIFISENNRVIVDNIHKSKKIVRVLDNTKLKKNKNLFSKTLLKLSIYEDYILVDENKSKLKVRTKEGIYGYISTKKVKNIIEIRSDYIEEESQNYNIIRNYSNPEDNFDNVKKVGEFNAAVIDLFNISVNKNILTISQNYNPDDSSYKIYREKLKINNIETIGSINLENYDLSKYLETFLKRQDFIYQILKIANKHNINAIEINLDDNTDIKLYENFIQELKPRLKERGLKLTILKDKIKSDKIKENIDYES